jgi:hypothetical protein
MRGLRLARAWQVRAAHSDEETQRVLALLASSGQGGRGVKDCDVGGTGERDKVERRTGGGDTELGGGGGERGRWEEGMREIRKRSYAHTLARVTLIPVTPLSLLVPPSLPLSLPPSLSHQPRPLIRACGHFLLALASDTVCPTPHIRNPDNPNGIYHVCT